MNGMMGEFRSRLLLYILAYAGWLVAFWALTGGPSAGSEWLSTWIRWDAFWYEKVWTEGYPQSDPRAIVFPPGYSLLIGITSRVSFTGFHLTALVVNAIAYFTALVLAAEVMTARRKTPPMQVFLFALSSPASYFVFTAYSDSVFMWLLWTAVYAALLLPDRRVARTAEAAVLLLLPWVRLTGYALVSWVVLGRRSAAMILLSLIGWLGLNWYITGRPDYFLEAQKLFEMPSGHILDGITYTFSGLLPDRMPETTDSWTAYSQFHLLPALYFCALSAAGLWLMIKREWLLALALFAILVMSHNQSFWRSVVRYDLPLMPMLGAAMLALLARMPFSWAGRLVLILIVVAQFMLQIYFATLFQKNLWAF
jgi:hypothetical protein